MDLNYVLEWLAGISAGVSLLVHGARFRFRFRGWVLVFLLILAVLAVGKIMVPGRAGLLATAVWLVLFLLPALLGRWLGFLMLRQRFDVARVVAHLLAILHPLDGWRRQPAYVAILSQIQRGDLQGARSRLSELTDENIGLARFVTAHLMRAEGDWRGLRTWFEQHADSASLMRDPHLAVLYIRALGETGDVDAMASAYSRLVRTPIGIASRQTLRLYVAALAGRPDIVEGLFDAGLRGATPEIRQYWLATAAQAAGDAGRARAALQELAQSGTFAVRAGAGYRMTWSESLDEPVSAGEATRELLERMADDVRLERRYGLRGRASRATPVTWGLLALNAGVFLLEVPGGSEEPENLIQLGALVVGLEGANQWWRIFTAGFLHFGMLHLALNAVGIWFLGRYTERVWGRWTLLVCYLAATFGANAVALVLLEILYDAPAYAVGASGGVMGILGAALAFTSIEWVRTRASLLRRHVAMFAIILGLQIVFDVVTPNVSSMIHLSGLGIGILLGAVLALRQSDSGSV